MLVELLFMLGLTSVTVVVHAVGTFQAISWMSREVQLKGAINAAASIAVILRFVAILLVLHWFEAAVWAGVYVAVGAIADFETAMYFSLTSYTTLGYGDVVLAPRWRLLGPFEGAVGILMFGWSTGVMVAAVARLYGRRLYGGAEPPSPSAF